MYDLLTEYETQVNLLCVIGLLCSFFFKFRIYLSFTLVTLFYSLLMLNTFVNILAKGL